MFFQLANGLRFVYKPVNSSVSHLGIMVNVGTRDENVDEHGGAHLIEHLLFKGTKTKTAKNISLKFDNIGADVNAYTTKEETCFHVSFLSEYLPNMMSLMSDMLFNSTFPAKETEKEINVIKEEIFSYNDVPAELIYDEFEDALYAGHSLGRNILGTEQSLDDFCLNKDKIFNFFNHNYVNDNIIIWAACNVPEDKFKNYCIKYFQNSPLKSGVTDRKLPPEVAPFDVIKDRSDTQCHVIIGSRAFSFYDENYTAFCLLNNYIGNQGFSSPLNYVLREQHGYVYQVESSYTPYFDTGTFNIFFECEYEKQKRVKQLVFKELDKCRNKLMTVSQLEVAKNQFKGNVAVNADSNLFDAMSMAKSLMVFDKIESMEEAFAKIDKVTASDIMNAANVTFDEKNLSVLTYRPVE